MPAVLYHPIQIAAARSGLTAHVIRAWERRYRAVEPQRDDSGRRLYSEEEIDRLNLLRAATDAGHPIRSVAGLPATQLAELVEKSRASRSAEDSPAIAAGATIREECLRAIRRLDGAALERGLQRGIVALGHQGFLQVVVAPLAEQIGELWRAGIITAAHEHFFTASAKVFLGQLSKQFAIGEEMPNLIACTPAGQLHELGAFMAGVAATHLGWRVAYLGASLPSAEIAGAATQQGAAVVALSIIYPEDDPHLPDELISLRRYLPAESLIIVGGRAAPAYRDALLRIGALVVNSLTEYCNVLDRLRKGRVTSAQPA